MEVKKEWHICMMDYYSASKKKKKQRNPVTSSNMDESKRILC